MEEKENNTDGKRKIPPSIPANYISILQLQERWIQEKERKRKEEEEEGEEERRRKQQAEEQQRTEEDLKKAEEDVDENRANRSNRKHCGRTSKKNESIEKEETAAIGSERGGDEGLPEKKRGRRKRYESKKKRTNLEVASVKEVVVDECGSIPPPEYVVTENHTPVKEAILVSRKKGEKATAVETQFEDLSIDRGETKNLKAETRSSNRNRHNQKHDLRRRRVRMPTESATMVWVKKGQNEKADDGNGSGVKPLNA